jgi:hypothetical protein
MGIVIFLKTAFKVLYGRFLDSVFPFLHKFSMLFNRIGQKITMGLI